VVGPALIVTYLSLLVLLPVAALLTKSLSGGPAAFWNAITQPEAVAALELTAVSAAVVAAVNALAGLVIAWVLVRDEFPGQRLLGAIIDLPFALPTVVAGLTLLALYGPDSPFGVNVAGTRIGIMLALAFVTLPFCVRSVQPVLAELDKETEEAASSLGASPARVFWRVVLPGLVPAMVAGAGMAFARALGEYGSVVLVSNNIPFHTEVASSYIFGLNQSGELSPAAAVSVLLIASALVVLLLMGLVRRRFGVGLST
jgi:sulfate transport system permease protein